ncbi:MAG: ATP-binding cassette domain-containing protein [Candidatus Sericytochromatia bacterium]|nr:ATP-binding cassette domain-containing protein [Candidatus Sericytochromatia bacterium]
MSCLTVALHQDQPVPLQLRFALPLGQTLVLFGPSASGKTTVLRSLAGLYTPRQAQIAFGESSWTDTERGHRLPPQQRPLGMVFQDDALFPHLSALQHLLLVLPASADRQQAALDLLAALQLTHRQAARPAQLSGGERKRLGLARALARLQALPAGLLLLDEPFSALDRDLKHSLYELLKQWRSRLQLTLVLVTHDLQEAFALADQMLLMHQGQCLQLGSPAALKAAPVSDKVARWLDLSF